MNSKPRGCSFQSILGVLCLLASQASANDQFASPQAITGMYGNAPGTTVNATLESGEPTTTAGVSGGLSVWFQWAAPANGSFTFTLTAGSDTQLAIYTGSAVNSLTTRGESDVSGLGGESVTLAATAATVYRVRVTVRTAPGGPFTLNWTQNVTPVYEKLLSFNDALAADLATGASPVGTLVQAADGNFYGTTFTGGERNQGTVFKMTRGGVLTTLVEFNDSGEINRGWRPAAGLVLGSDGNFYGTTYAGGEFSKGTVFRMTPGGVLTTLVNFSGNGTSNRGSNPQAGLVQGSDGNFYGTTFSSGASFSGTVFKMSPGGILTTLVEFTGNGAINKGANPQATLIQGSDGNFYGTTYAGGASNLGTVFKMTPGGMLTTLVEFSGNGTNNKGSGPQAGLVQDGDGNFYGTTSAGGAHGFGTVFKITPGGALPLTTLVAFTGNGADNKGKSPQAELVQGGDGNFYGTTFYGGASDQGTVFKVTPAGMLTTLVEFKGTGENRNGSNPAAGLVQGGDGNFYCTSYHGGIGGVSTGDNGFGTVFKMTPGGTLTTLVEFTNVALNNQGSSPEAGLAQDSAGNFYGTTKVGGTVSFPVGLETRGTVFKMSPTRALATLVRFTDNGMENRGHFPMAGLVPGSDGNFYGTTSGGALGFGTVFKMTAGGGLTTLVEFTGNGTIHKGSFPMAGLVPGNTGEFYGTTSGGGALGLGTVFKISTDGTSGGTTLETLVEFTGTGGTKKGSSPQAALVRDSDGNFYGTTSGGGVPGFGTVFKMTPSGALTWVKEFTGTVDPIKGAVPKAGLVQGSDGNFYGTTYAGGALNLGTVFKISPGGTLTTLVEFTGTGGANKGSKPQAGLVLGSDGILYGTTSEGGALDLGTVFKMAPGGGVPLTTVVEFTIPKDGKPSAPLMLASDRNLYGTAKGPDGSIYRLIFPGAPDVFAGEAEVLGTASVLCQTMANARGVSTTVSLMYGLSESNLSSTVPIASALGGFQTTLVGTTLDNLSQGTTYYYRFRATSSAGTTDGPVQSFLTLAEPVVLVDPATDILANSARFNGMVNARNFASTVVFEYGTDGNVFPFSVPAAPPTVTGNTAVAVNKVVPELAKGMTYYYRVVATNAAGTSVSATSMFSTLTDPVATVGPASAGTSQSARLNGFVNPLGALASVSFEYGTDGVNFPSNVGATPPTVSGGGATPVYADLTGLAQGATYHYRVKATSAGGVGISSPASFTLDIISGLTQVMPSAPPAANGFMIVNLSPAGIGGWRFTGEQTWRASGVPVGGLTTSDRVIEFLPVDTYIQPPPEPVTIVSGGAATIVNLSYQDIGQSGGGSGGVNVIIKPDSLSDSGVPEAKRAQWRLSKLGVNTDPWLNSGHTLTDLQPGSYLLEFKPIEHGPAEPEYATPSPTQLIVDDGTTSSITTTYFLKDAQTGLAPALIPFETVSTNPQLPYAHIGQIRSDSGLSTGFVVKQRVVATAGHVVFDDGTLSVVTNLQWLFQRDSASHEPKPQIPRGVHLLDDYAAARSAPGAVPGVGTPESQNRDAAAMFFSENAGRGGYSGFLASDAIENEFLTSTSQKTLAGYPVDGAEFIGGRMYATAPMNVHLTRVNALDEFGAPFRTYTTPDIRGVGGMSGGPLCVQFEGGSYYPAAIYLGGNNQTIVRAIDSKIIAIFNRAELSAIAGDNNTGGGITLTSSTSITGNSPGQGSLRVVIKPDAVRTMGAGWRIGTSGSYRTSGQSQAADAGTQVLQLTPVNGYEIPAENLSVTIVEGKQRDIVYTYVDINDAPTLSSVSSKTIAEDTATAAIPLTLNDVDNSENSLTMSAASSNTALVPKANIVFGGSGGNRTVTLTPLADRNGSATITLTVSDGKLTANRTFLLTVTPTNDAPTLSTIADQNVPLDTATGAIPLTLGDIDTPVGTLTLASASSNPALVPTGAIVFGGSDANRSFTITPASGQLGSALITVTVSDGALTASSAFTLTVTGTARETWRLANFGTASNTGTAADTADPDGDSSPNLAEYAAGTDPNSASDVFKILTSTKNATTFTVTAAGKATRSYALERRATLDSGPWTTVASDGPLATDGSITLTDPLSAPASSFYRLRVSVP